MIKRNIPQKNKYLLGYRAKGIQLYKTPIKPFGYIVGGLGIVCLGVAVFPNGLGLLFYPMGFYLNLHSLPYLLSFIGYA